jgi:hypothetical protein
VTYEINFVIISYFKTKKSLMDHDRVMYGGRSRQMSPEWRSGKRKFTGTVITLVN